MSYWSVRNRTAAPCFSGSESTVRADRHDLIAFLVQMELRLSLRPRVLLADDYPDMVKAVSRLLALDCEIVGTVADGSVLLEAAQRLQPDVIVLDVNLPNVQSLEACREIRRVNPATKVIMFTGWPIWPPARRSSGPEHLPSSQSSRPKTCCRPSSDCVLTKAESSQLF